MKVVIASDKFKGSLTSQEVANCIEEGILAAMPDCSITKLLVADGGDGTAEAMIYSLNGYWITKEVKNPLGKPIMARYGIVNNDTAVLDVATASGIALLNKADANPLETSSIGTGELILDAINNGYKKIMIGVGGSATNDAATGILYALGYRFLDDSGNVLYPCGKNLSRICTIDKSSVTPEIKDCEFTLLCDVDASYYGKNGAAYLFAPQKGADEKMVKMLDDGLQTFANLISKTTGKNVQHQSYSGAAGGIGGSLWALLGAKLTPGIYTLLNTINFEKAIQHADLVITGEGSMDKVSLLGKTPYGVCGEAAWNGVPTIAFVGEVSDYDRLNEYGFLSVYPIQPGPIEMQEAMNPSIASENLKRTVTQVFRTLLINAKK